MTRQHRGGDGASATPGHLVLLRHGQTAWSASGQYTGRSNIPLTATGERQAIDAGVRLRERFPDGFQPDHVFVSPLLRARQTAALAGYGTHRTLDGLAEWDYGRAEGRTQKQIAELTGVAWDVWRHGPQALDPSLEGDWMDTLPSGEQVPVHNGPGESVDEVAARTREAIEQVMPLIEAGDDVLMVAHAHVLRILTTQWLEVDPRNGRRLVLDTAHYSVLNTHRGERVIERWNL